MDKFENEAHGVIGSEINYETFKLSLVHNNLHISLPMLSRQQIYMNIPARCRHNLIPVKILNTREQDIQLRNFCPTLADAKDYEMLCFEAESPSVSRVDKLLDLIETNSLNKEEKFLIQKICAKYADVFHLPGDPVSTTNIGKQKIRLKPEAVPVYVKPYRFPHAQKEEIQDQIETMLKNGIIEEAKSQWSAPLLIVPKKPDHDGVKKYRVVIDYRLLNREIQDEKWPLGSISEILDSLGGAMYFSTLDLAQGYYQVELAVASRPCTAFTTDRGQYQMTRLPMGLKISPSAFSRLMTIAMSGLNYVSCFVYLDDLIVFGNNLTNHNKNLIKILQRLREVNLKINPNKCQFMRKEVLYLGHTITAEQSRLFIQIERKLGWCSNILYLKMLTKLKDLWHLLTIIENLFQILQE